MIKKILLLFLLSNLFFTTSCSFNTPLRNKMLDYYTKNENYEELQGIIISTNYIVATDELVLDVSIVTENHNFQVNAESGYVKFVIVKYGKENHNLAVNDEIFFTSAPMYFYNGHYLPIIYLEKDNEVLLEFKEGKEIYLHWIKEEFN